MSTERTVSSVFFYPKISSVQKKFLSLHDNLDKVRKREKDDMLKQINQQLLNLAFSGLQIGIAVFDKAGNKTASNDVYDELQKEYQQESSIVKLAVKEGTPQKEIRTMDDGTCLEEIVVPVINEAGETDGFICHLNDVTERETMIEALRMAKEEVTEDIRLEEIFINNLNHEIRTPLNAIIGFNDILNGVAGHHMDETEKMMMKQHIHKNADRLIRLINDILDLSKMEKGTLTVHKTVVRLMEVCCRARDAVKGELQQGVKLLHEYPVALQDTRIYTDEKRLEQLLRNILSNACRHTAAGSITLKVSLFNDELDGEQMLRIRVDDTGSGIPMEKRDELFKPFKKLHDSTQGLGMGLAICKQIAKMLDGHIYLDHSYTEGSSFVFEMPFEAIKDNI